MNCKQETNRHNNFRIVSNDARDISSHRDQVYVSQSPETFAYDDDGNQTLITTATGLWRVTYNGENRPVRWELVSPDSNTPNSNTQTLLQMSYDHMGRRRTKNDQRFFYDGYLQVCNFHSQPQPSTSTSYFIWDCTEKIATRPLVWHRGNFAAYYTHDGNKNVSEVVAIDNDIAAHYEYAPFGALILSRGASAEVNPFRFSSEYAEDDTATVYYNYRHYEPMTGRWMSRDPIEEVNCINLFLFIRNQFRLHDVLGLKDDSCSRIGVFNIIDISIKINPSDKAFDQKGALADAENLLKILAKNGFSGATYGLSNIGRVLRLIYSGADYYSRKKANSENLGELGQELGDFAKKYLEGIFRIDGRLEFELCMCRSGKLRFVKQEDILDSEDVDFECPYDFDWYKSAINGAIKSVEKELLKKLGEKVKEAQDYE